MLKTFVALVKDVVALLISLTLALWVRSFIREGQLGLDTYSVFRHFVLFVPIICISILFFLIYGLYDRHVLYKRRKLVQHILMASAGTFIGGIVWFYLFPLDLGLRPKLILLLYVVFGVIGAMIARYSYLIYGKKGQAERSSFNMVCIGGSNEMENFYTQLVKVNYVGYKPIHLIDPKSHTTDQGVEMLREKLLADKVQYVVLDTRDDHAIQLGRKLYSLVFEGVKFITFQDMYERIYDREDLTYVDEEWFINNITAKNDHVYMILKRVMDLLIAVPLLLISLIVYPFVYLAIKIDDGGVIFLHMERIGQNNKIIKIIKFRSMGMLGKATHDDGTWALKEGKSAEDKDNAVRQQRVTRVGKIIRKTRIDELPQLWNVVKGDLSLIGPRPEMPKMVEVYEKEIPFYSARHTIRPGLSGWAQIHHEVPPHSIEGTKEKLSYDLYYLKHRSIFLDLLIALRTIQTLLSAVGV